MRGVFSSSAEKKSHKSNKIKGENYMIHAVTFENHNKYNFSMTLENQMDAYQQAGQVKEMIFLLESHLDSILHTIKYFGNDEMAHEMVKKINHLVTYHCLPFNKCKLYYAVAKEVANLNPHYPNINHCIELMYRHVDLIKHQYNI
jgi:hypothetical protein